MECVVGVLFVFAAFCVGVWPPFLFGFWTTEFSLFFLSFARSEAEGGAGKAVEGSFIGEDHFPLGARPLLAELKRFFLAGLRVRGIEHGDVARWSAQRGELGKELPIAAVHDVHFGIGQCGIGILGAIQLPEVFAQLGCSRLRELAMENNDRSAWHVPVRVEEIL